MIDSKDVSVVIQGAIDYRCILSVVESVKRVLPNSELIISTWEGTILDYVEYDKIICSRDVGGYKDLNSGFINNTARQIMSSLAGIRNASRKYVLKIRSDLILTSSGFLEWFDRYPVRDKRFTYFKKKVLCCSYFFKKYLGVRKARIQPVIFHLSDWCFFGLREDVLKIFDIKLPEEPDNTNYFLNHKYYTVRPSIYISKHRFTPEQYIFYQCFKSAFPEDFKGVEHMYHYSSTLIELYEKLVVSNFIILDVDEFSLYCSKNDGVDPYFEWSRDVNNLP